jgi:type I restriction enzyme S subunit
MKRASVLATIEDQPDRDDLPEGWVDIVLGDHIYIAGRIGWRGLKAEEYTPSGPIFLSVPNLNHGDYVDFSKVNHITQARFEESPEIQLRRGDTLLVKDGAGIGKLGYVASLPGAATVNSSLLVIRPGDGLLYSYYLFFYLKGPKFQHIALQRITGSTTPHLFQKDIKQLRVLVPPISEQRGIVNKVRDLSKQVSVLRERLAKVLKILKAFRRSVLAAACSGRLTEDWRATNVNSGSSELLAGILSKRLQMFSLDRARYKEPCEPDMSLSPEVPEDWVVTSMDAITCAITSGSRDWRQYYRDDGPGTFVMAQNVRPLYFDRSFRLAVAPPLIDRDRARSEVRLGDLLVTIVGANTGDVCMVAEPVQQHYVCQSVALMRPVMPETARFLEFYLNSQEHGQAQYRSWIYGEGRPHLSFDHLKATAIAFPPLEEQQEIVRRVDALFKLADAIEMRVEVATKRADKLTQAILAKAFRGELVPTEAELARQEGRTYEPASVLLERIKAGREKSTTSNNVRKGRKATSGKK